MLVIRMTSSSSSTRGVSAKNFSLHQTKVIMMRCVASAFFGIAFLHSFQAADAGWHEHLSMDIDHEGTLGGSPRAAAYPAYTHGNHMNPDETITYPGVFWLGQHESLAEGTSIASFAEPYSFPPPQPSYELPQAGQPGSSLLSLANILKRGSPQLRLPLLRHFCTSVARLRTRLVGIGKSEERIEKPSKKRKSKKKNALSNKKESLAAAERRITALSSRLAGVLEAAQRSPDSGTTLTKYLLLPFGRLFAEAEKLLSDIALQGDVSLMIRALDQLAPLLVRGLSYLEAPQSQGAAEVLEPARDCLIERARELDTSLLEAQADLVGVLRAYNKDISPQDIEREKQLAALERGPDQEQYIPPVYKGGQEVDEKFRRQARAAFFLCLFLTISSVVTAIALIPPVLPTPRQDTHGKKSGQHRRRRGRGRVDFAGGSGNSSTDSETGVRAPSERGRARDTLEETLGRHRDWIREQRREADQAFTEQSVDETHFEAIRAPYSPASYAEGHFVYEPGSPPATAPIPPYLMEPQAPPLPFSAPPTGPPFLRIPRRSPPPPYEEAVRSAQDSQ